MLNPPKKLTICPNCQTPLDHDEDYCPSCGQKNEDIILPVHYHLKDVIESVFNWDSRLLRTLKVMFFQPGELTLEFNKGKRKKYVPPLRLYFMASILFFLLYSILNRQQMLDLDGQVKNHIEHAKDTLNLNMGFFSISMPGDQIREAINYNDTQIDSLLIAHKIANNWANRLSFKQSMRILSGNVKAFINSLTQAFSTAMFFLMPAFAFLLYFVFYRQRKFYVEHLIASIHIHTLAFILFSISISITLVFPVFDGGWIFILSFFGYAFINLKNVYQKNWLLTFFLFFLLLFLYTIVLVFGLIMAGFVSLLLF